MSLYNYVASAPLAFTDPYGAAPWSTVSADVWFAELMADADQPESDLYGLYSKEIESLTSLWEHRWVGEGDVGEWKTTPEEKRNIRKIQPCNVVVMISQRSSMPMI